MSHLAEFIYPKTRAWNPKQPFINGCFNWMIPNLYIGNGCFTKHLFINGCLGFQVHDPSYLDVPGPGSERIHGERINDLFHRSL